MYHFIGQIRASGHIFIILKLSLYENLNLCHQFSSFHTVVLMITIS